MWNFLDIATMMLVLIAPSNEMRNHYHCIHHPQRRDVCIDKIPGKKLNLNKYVTFIRMVKHTHNEVYHLY